LRRLYFYYPEEAEPLTLKLLSRPLRADEQANVVSGLSGLGGSEVDKAVARVFRSLAPGTDDLALACMNRLIGKGMDKEFKSYCESRIAELKKRNGDSGEEQRLEQLQQRLAHIRRAEGTRKEDRR
jgi:hypothetical protein